MKSKVSVLSNLSDAEVDKIVKIAGTQYDRRRVVTEKMIEKAKKYLARGKDYDYISRKLNVSVRTIRYHLDDEYREHRKKNSHTAGSKTYSFSSEQLAEKLVERVLYKKSLVALGKVSV